MTRDYTIKTRVNVSAKTTEANRNKYYVSASKDKNPSTKEVIDKLLPNYYDYVDLFDRKAAYNLLPYRPGLDYEIKLLLGKQLLFKRPYPMSALENEIVKH